MTGEKFFDFFAKHQQARQDFQNVMKLNNLNRPSWTDVYPAKQLLDGASLDKPVFVDIGGGLGGDVELLRVEHPELPKGSLILQDTPEVVAEAEVKEPI